LYEESFYEQTEGAAMGSSLSLVIANLYMEHIEQLALQSTTQTKTMAAVC